MAVTLEILKAPFVSPSVKEYLKLYCTSILLDKCERFPPLPLLLFFREWFDLLKSVLAGVSPVKEIVIAAWIDQTPLRWGWSFNLTRWDILIWDKMEKGRRSEQYGFLFHAPHSEPIHEIKNNGLLHKGNLPCYRRRNYLGSKSALRNGDTFFLPHLVKTVKCQTKSSNFFVLYLHLSFPLKVDGRIHNSFSSILLSQVGMSERQWLGQSLSLNFIIECSLAI